MIVRRLSSIGLVTLLLLQTLALNYVPEVDAASPKGGQLDDFSIFSIEVGNVSSPTEQWIQPNGEELEYIIQGSTKEITVTVFKDGPSGSGGQKQTDVKLEIVHPIGFVIETYTWITEPISGQQKDENIILWNPQDAHSILNTSTNELTGGIILRASVNYSKDDRNANDILEKQVPIAIHKDLFDGEASGSSLTFRPARYPISGNGNAFAVGSWYENTDSNLDSVVGSTHWTMSQNGNEYPSNAFDRLVHSYKTTSGQAQECSLNGDTADSGLTNIEGISVCRKIFSSQEYISSQIHLQAWGNMEDGDSAYLEFWTGSGNFSDPLQSIHWNVEGINPSPIPNKWKNISWDPQTVWLQNPALGNTESFLGGNSFTFGLVFKSDNLEANQGMHFDDFVQFGVSRVDGYTLTAECENPVNGFITVPNDLVSWKCSVTNNGYKSVQFRAQTNVTNATWMDPFMPQLRLETDNPNDNDFDVVIPAVKPFQTTEVWANLSIPPGADVQSQTWDLWFTDAGSANTGEKARVSTTVLIGEQYSVKLTSNSNQVALTMEPGDSDSIDFRIQNTGNLDSTFLLTPTFSDVSWSGNVKDDTGSVITQIFLLKGESADLSLMVNAYEQASPGQINVNISASRLNGPVFGETTIYRTINMPIYRDFVLEMNYDQFTSQDNRLFVEGYANGEPKSIFFTLTNNGNADEAFNITVNNQFWQVGAYVDDAQTDLLNEWGGQSAFLVNLPMPVGLGSGYYEVEVTATSVSDPTLSTSQIIPLEIRNTASVYVETVDSDQSYIPGDIAQSMTFEVRNDGNIEDTFEMSLNIPDGMNAAFTGLVDGTRTTPIESGASVNVTVEFSFDDGISSELNLIVIAKSIFDDGVIATGGSTYNVGSSQNQWLKILPIQQVIIDDYEDEVVIEVVIKNQFSTAQSVSMDIDPGNSSSWYQSRIDSSDRQFAISSGGERVIRITFDISESTLRNLETPVFETEIILWARSDTVNDAAQSVIQVQLRKIIDETTDDQSSSFDYQGAAMWTGFLIIIIAGVIITIRILKNVEDDEDDYGGWGEAGYQDSITANYQTVISAPKLQPDTKTPPIQTSIPTLNQLQPAELSPVAQQPVVETSSAAGPPLPSTGLPEGWSMDQWNAYGHEWLKHQQ